MIAHRKIFYIISGILLVASLSVFFMWGLKPAIDFTGGTLLEVEYKEIRPTINIVKENITALNFGNVLIQPIGEKGLLLRLRDITDEEHRAVITALGEVEQKRFDSIGPTIGKELVRKAWMSIIFVLLMIVIFIAWAFRKAGRPVSSWKYGTTAILALAHDIIIPIGLFSVLGHFYNIEVDILFVTALLTILGFSVHDTIVVFDRIRENLKRGLGGSFEETVSKSLKQVRGRSIKTSSAILMVLLALLFFGGITTKYFALTLVFGIIFGTYSSLFLASPLLVTWYNFDHRKKK